MGKRDALAVELDHLRLDRRPKLRFGVRVKRSIKQRNRGLGERGCVDERLMGLLGQGGEPFLDERAQRSRHGKLGVRIGSAAASSERARELERVERIAAGDLVQPTQHGPRKRHPEAHPDQRVERSETQRPDSFSVHPFVGERGGKRRGGQLRRVPTSRREEAPPAAPRADAQRRPARLQTARRSTVHRRPRSRWADRRRARAARTAWPHRSRRGRPYPPRGHRAGALPRAPVAAEPAVAARRRRTPARAGHAGRCARSSSRPRRAARPGRRIRQPRLRPRPRPRAPSCRSPPRPRVRRRGGGCRAPRKGGRVRRARRRGRSTLPVSRASSLASLRSIASCILRLWKNSCRFRSLRSLLCFGPDDGFRVSRSTVNVGCPSANCANLWQLRSLDANVHGGD